MLNLRKYDLTSRKWEQETIPFRYTLLEALFPHRDFAIVHVDDERSLIDALENLDPITREDTITALSGNIADGWRVDFASGSRKNGDFFMSQSHEQRAASHFWQTAEEAIAYGSMLVTDCRSMNHIHDLCVLVVEDGEYDTGDCHAKASPQLYALLDGDERLAVQFRLAVLDGNKGHGHIAKGTAIIASPGGPDTLFDLIIPLSSFKGYKPTLGAHIWDAQLGVVSWSESRPTKVGYTILQWFARETIDADVLPHIPTRAARLVTAGQSNQAAVDFFRLDHKGGEYDKTDSLFFNILANDTHNRLTDHPYVVDRLGRALRRQWLHLATGGGLKWTGFMGVPCDSLKDDEVCIPELPTGEIIGTRYPTRSWEDVRIWHNVHVPRLMAYRGIVWMNHATAATVAGDFDGDYFIVEQACKFPTMAREIKTWTTRQPIHIEKNKTRLASPLDGPNLARVCLANTDNMVGLLTYFMAQANAMRRLDLVAILAPEIQIAVDKFKFDLRHNYGLIEHATDQLISLAWLDAHKKKTVYVTEPMTLGRHADDTISHLARNVNEHWQPPTLTKRPLQEFASLFPKTQDHRDAALTLNARYAALVRTAMQAQDKDAFRPIFQTLRAWADSRQDPDAWASAVWHAVHRKNAKGSGSLAFNAFPVQVMAAINAPPTIPARVAIVGLKYNDYAAHVYRLVGQVLAVDVRAETLGADLRSAVYIAGKRLGFISPETPVQIGHFTFALTCLGAVVYATAAT